MAFHSEPGTMWAWMSMDFISFLFLSGNTITFNHFPVELDAEAGRVGGAAAEVLRQRDVDSDGLNALNLHALPELELSSSIR
jgi:hypothetical protein